MSRMLGAMYFMLPGIVIALAVGYGVALSYRTRRTYVVVLIWLTIIVLAALTGHWAKQASSPSSFLLPPDLLILK